MRAVTKNSMLPITSVLIFACLNIAAAVELYKVLPLLLPLNGCTRTNTLRGLNSTENQNRVIKSE